MASVASPPDLLRLLAVPVLAWVAYHDYRTRRVPNRVWYPLVVLGAVALVWEAAIVSSGTIIWRRFLVSVALSLGILVPLAYGFYRAGGFGGADAKAFMTLALLFPTYPLYRVGPLVLPVSVPAVGVFSLTIITDTVLVGALYPVALAARNAAAGHVSPAMFVGRPVGWRELLSTHGKLLETGSGFTRRGLDLDALRMYLRWRGVPLAALRERSGELRDPASLPADPNPPTDGVVDPNLDPRADGGSADVEAADEDLQPGDDPWGAEAFLADVGNAYGTTPETLRDGLDVLATEETVWVSPGIPFLVPLFLGLVVALTYGDVLFALLEFTGMA